MIAAAWAASSRSGRRCDGRWRAAPCRRTGVRCGESSRRRPSRCAERSGAIRRRSAHAAAREARGLRTNDARTAVTLSRDPVADAVRRPDPRRGCRVASRRDERASALPRSGRSSASGAAAVHAPHRPRDRPHPERHRAAATPVQADQIELPRRRRCRQPRSPRSGTSTHRDRRQRRCSSCRHGESHESGTGGKEDLHGGASRVPASAQAGERTRALALIESLPTWECRICGSS